MAAARNNRRRRRGRSRFGGLLKVLCALAVLVALTMGATVFFQVEQVEVIGNHRYTAEEVVEASGIQVGDNLYHMNKFAVAREMLEELPYTRELLIRRRLPNTIVITVTEWDAVARVEAPPAGAVVEGEENPLEVAREDWLISVGGKLLEPAAADSDEIRITGITPIMPRAGTKLALPQAEAEKSAALLALLQELETLDMLDGVSAIDLASTHMTVRYEDRFDVKLPLTGDLNYKLRVLVAVVHGQLDDQAAGELDLTQEGVAALYTPA